MEQAKVDAPQVDTAIQEVKQSPAPAAENPANTEGTQPVPAPAQPPAAEVKPNAEYKWSDDWRERMARGNEAVAKRLTRYSSPEAVAEALANAQEKISSGQLKTPAPKDNPEALARWREENGIPQKWEDYDVSELANGIVLGEEDMEGVNGFLQEMHKNNVHPDVVKSAVGWYKQYEFDQYAKMTELDKQSRIETEQAMIEEWGSAAISEKNAISNFLKANGLEDLQLARLPDGRAFGNNFEMIRKLAAIVREINPGATVVPGSSNPLQSIQQEKAAIEKKMGTTLYTQQDSNRYQELLVAEGKLSARK